MAHTHRYVPAAGHDWLLPLYDPRQRLAGGEGARRRLVDQAALVPGQRVLEIGCGTGDLLMRVKRLFPTCDVVGLDPDPKALARARKKAERAGLEIRLEEGFAGHLPFADASFDRVFSSFMLHHLTHPEKVEALREVHRVLRRDGGVHILDFGDAAGVHDLVARLFFSGERGRDNLEGRIPELLRAARFEQVAEVGRRFSLFGPIVYYRGLREGASPAAA